jgi:hypothetical protein
MNEGNQSFSTNEDQSMVISESDQSMLVSEEGDQSMLVSEEGDQNTLISKGDLLEISSNEDVIEDILDDILEESKDEVNANFPNEAYGDLMALVTKHNFSNSTANTIIKFFNKHANLSISPLPKSIKQGREYMANMNLSTLTFTKTCVRNYNNIEYFLHHRSLINCIKNILSIPDMLQNFALTFEKLEVIIFV